MIKVLEFADVINRHDFIDMIVKYANPEEFRVDVCVRTSESNIAKPEFPSGTRYQVLNGRSRRNIPKTVFGLARLLREWEIDVLHTHHYDQAVIGWMATRIVRRTKFVLGRHYSDLVQILPGIKRTAYLAIEQRLNRDAAQIIVPSRYIFEILTQKQKISADKINVIPYGFEPEKFSSLKDGQVTAARRAIDADGRFVVTALGQITGQKGAAYLTDAIISLKDRIPNILMVFVGEGPARTYIEAAAEAAGMRDNFRLTGWRKDAMAYMANAHVVVQPSLSEAFSQVMGEAMYLSKPLVVTDVGGAMDIIRSGENGVMVPKANSPAIADAIFELYRNRELRERVAREGRRFVEEELSMKKIIGLYENTFRSAVGN